MRIGIIDLGTNSVRFDVQQISHGNPARMLHREKLMIRLGQGLFLDGKLDPDAISRTVQAFTSFHRTCTLLQADKIIAFGTSALREAADAERLLFRIRKKTGIDVRVISGEEEAKLIALGILVNERSLKGRFGLLDIGGGSTEISICQGRELRKSASFPLGTARLQQLFLKSSPPKPGGTDKRGNPLGSPIDQLRRYIRGAILPTLIADDWPKTALMMGSSGTIRSISRIVRKGSGGKAIDRKSLDKLIKSMSTMTTTQLLGIPGMEAKRVDMILAGAVLLEECMQALSVKKVVSTDYSLRDGILSEELRMYRQQKGSHIAFHLDGLYAKARRLGCNESHLRQVVAISETLFDKLAPLHKLKPHWRQYLTAAAILHDAGESISPAHHEIHSYYIVTHSDFPSMEKWESEFVAQLCLRHRGGKISAKELEFVAEEPRKQAFVKLLAILRIADALDRGHKAGVKIQRVRIDRAAVTLTFSSKVPSDLELLRIEQKKSLFEQTFKRRLVAHRK